MYHVGLGVFAKRYIPRGVRVGPYEGRRVLANEMDDVADTSYIWEVSVCVYGHV